MAILLLIAAFGAAADQSESLYQAELMVSSKDEASRDDNLRQALTTVLGRLITREAMSSKRVGSILARPADYVDEFEYLPPKDGLVGNLMRVRFDEEAIQRTLQRSGVAVWGGGRPEFVIWLWTFEPTGRQLVVLKESPEFELPLTLAATNRSLKWIAPLGDLTDQSGLSAEDATKANLQRVREATWRYESDFALVGELRRFGEQTWDASWRLVGPTGSDAWQAKALDRDAALTAGVDGMFDRLLKLYAATGRSSAPFELEVEGISSMQDADRCGAYLRSLPLVLRVDWLRAEANRTTWRLTVTDRPEVVARMLSVSRALRAGEGSGNVKSAGSYRWVP